MDKISNFINEVHSIDVFTQKHYLVENMGYMKEDDVPQDSKKYLKSKMLYVVDKCSESTIRNLYNNAKLSLVFLSDKELENALKLLQDYGYKHFDKSYTTYYMKLSKGEAHPMHDTYFLNSLQNRLKNDVPDYGVFTMEFMHDLMDDVGIKRGYMYSLTQDVKKLLGVNDEDITPEELQSMSTEPDTNTEDTIEVVAEKPSDSNTKITTQIKSLFNFIDFLHANIVNFKLFDKDIQKLKEALIKQGNLEDNYFNEVEKETLAKTITEKRKRISKYVLKPLESKVYELGDSIWNKPEQIYNFYIDDVNTLINKIEHKKISKNEIDEIIEVKRLFIIIRDRFKQYVEQNGCFDFLNTIASIIGFLEDVMKPITSFFYEDGDDMIPEADNISDKQKHDNRDNHIVPISVGSENMGEQEILSKINELTSKEYEEKYYLDGYNESTLTTLDPKIIHLTFSDIHSELNEAFELIYLRGKFDFLERIKAILSIDLKTINDLYEAGEWVPKCTYELEFEEFIDREKSFELIYNCKTQYIQKLIDKLNEYASVSERKKVQQTIESETITQSALSSSDNDDDVNIITEYEERVINAEKLGRYFKAQFKGMGRCENYFEPLIKELETITEDYKKKRIGKKIAQIALLIHNSDKLNSRRPEYFADWHKIFCECIAIPYTKYYPSDLKPFPKNLIDLFIYLN